LIRCLHHGRRLPRGDPAETRDHARETVDLPGREKEPPLAASTLSSQHLLAEYYRASGTSAIVEKEDAAISRVPITRHSSLTSVSSVA
jgi:hypothetical protein